MLYNNNNGDDDDDDDDDGGGGGDDDDGDDDDGGGYDNGDDDDNEGEKRDCQKTKNSDAFFCWFYVVIYMFMCCPVSIAYSINIYLYFSVVLQPLAICHYNNIRL